MATTNFAALTSEQLTAWSRRFWKAARNKSFVSRMAGRGPNNAIQRITELTRTEKGARAVLTLVADIEGDGVVGDYTLEGNEEAINAYDTVIQLDQLRNANRLAGRMADQKSVVNFRENSMDVLSYWMADRIDQLAFLTASGITYDKHNNGSDRPVKSTGQNLTDLEFAGDVKTPTNARHLRWDDASGSLVAGDTSAVTSADKLTYKTLVRAKAYAKDHYIRGVRANDGREFFHVFVTPSGMADLRLDDDYLANVRNAAARGEDNELFKGADVVWSDGLLVHEFRHVFNTAGAATGDKWGASNDVDGQRVLVMGAQALGFADINIPQWYEDEFDYKNQPGISVAKICGLLKPQFHSIYDGSKQDFGLFAIDTAI